MSAIDFSTQRPLKTRIERVDRNSEEYRRGGQFMDGKAASKSTGTSWPNVGVQGHWKVRNRSRIPLGAAVNQFVIYEPPNLERIPFDHILMEIP